MVDNINLGVEGKSFGGSSPPTFAKKKYGSVVSTAEWFPIGTEAPKTMIIFKLLDRYDNLIGRRN